MKMIRVYGTLEEIFPEGFTLATVQSGVNNYTQSKDTLDVKFGNVINILADEYSEWYVGYVDKWFIPGNPIVLTMEEQEKIGVNLLKKLMVIYNFSKDKYLQLLKLYEDEKNHLLDKLENKTITDGEHRVNDTPQNAGTGHQNFTDDDHTSLWESTDNTTTVTNDPMTIISRLEEVQNKYMNVLKAWCREFNSLFITPTNEFNVELEEGE